jgi:hypothetical protein
MSGDDLGARFARRWVRLYTTGLSPVEAHQRWEEIVSDLWEHHHDSVQSGQSRLRHNLEVIERVLSGIPADLSWRQGIQRSQPRPDTGDPLTTQQPIPRSTLALIIVAGVGIVAPFPFLNLLGTGLKIHEVLWVLGSIALAAILAVGLGLRLRTNRPVLSTVLLSVGAFAPSVAWFWLPPVYLLTVTVIIIALISARNGPVTQPSTT